jgi:Spy/CpxP family protein refolding chaperone
MLRHTLMMPLLLLLVSLPARAQTEDERPLVRFRMEQLQQTVGLPEDQARTVVERWSRYDREQFEKTRQIQQIRRRFNDILMGPGSEEEKNVKVRPLLDQFVDLRRQQAELKFKFEEDIRARLSPAQQVRLITHVEEMQRRTVEAIRQGLGNRSEPGLPLGAGIRRGRR